MCRTSHLYRSTLDVIMKHKTPSLHEEQATTSESISLQSKKIIYKSALNALIIVAISILVNLSIRADFSYLNAGFGEASITESLQLMMLVISVWAFYSLMRERKDITHAAALISGFFTVLAIREMDVWFDMIFHGAWVLPALTVTAVACIYAYRGGKNTVNEMATILNARHMNILIGGVVLLIVFSRLYGMGHFWHSVMGEHYIREVKNVSEESMELLCYCLIALAAVKTRISMRVR